MYTQLFKVKMTFTEPLLGSAPRAKEVYAKYIETKKPQDSEEKEAENVLDREERGWTGFLRTPETPEKRACLFVYDYTFKGFMKESGASLRETGDHAVQALKRKIGQHIHPEPRRILLHSPESHKGGPISKGGCGHGEEGSMCDLLHMEDAVLERPLRAETMQGPRVSLARSDVAKEGSWIEFNVRSLFPQTFNEEFFRLCLERGKYVGYGQWRTAAWGRFDYTLEKIGQSGEASAAEAPKKRGRPKKIEAPAEAQK